MSGLKILVNATNLRVGGGVQKATQFVLACCRWGDAHRWRMVLSPQVARYFETDAPPAWVDYEVALRSPARPVAGRGARRLLAAQERDFAPDVVFSVSGPNYHRFRRPHLMGFAIPWITNPDPLAWTTIRSPLRRALFRLRLRYYVHWARHADAWLLQTEAARDGLVANAKLTGPAHVVPNSCSEYYYDAMDLGADPHPALPARREGDVLLLVFTSPKPHKNLASLPGVARRLREIDPHTRYRFVLSLPQDSASWRELSARAERAGVGDRLVTVGAVPVADGPGLYAGCDALYLPTVMEVFSAAYPEAMAMARPILTSDLPFARSVCRDAARYFDPVSAESAATAVVEVVGDPDRRARLVEAGRARLADFGTGQERFEAIVGILADLAGGRWSP